jgi:hypothetical protein
MRRYMPGEPSVFWQVVAPPTIKTSAPVPAVAPQWTTSAPVAGCFDAGHLHLDFGGDIAHFGDAEVSILKSKIAVALKIPESKLQVPCYLARTVGR